MVPQLGALRQLSLLLPKNTEQSVETFDLNAMFFPISLCFRRMESFEVI